MSNDTPKRPRRSLSGIKSTGSDMFPEPSGVVAKVPEDIRDVASAKALNVVEAAMSDVLTHFGANRAALMVPKIMG